MGGDDVRLSTSAMLPAAALRHCLGVLLFDARRGVVTALRRGLTLDGQLAAVVEGGLRPLSLAERRGRVSGAERVTGEDFVKRLVPHFVAVGRRLQKNANSSAPAAAAREAVPAEAAAWEGGQPLRQAPAGQVANFKLLCRLLRGPAVRPHLTNFLRFVTGCPAFFGGAVVASDVLANSGSSRGSSSSSSSSSSRSSWSSSSGGSGQGVGFGDEAEAVGLCVHVHFKACKATCELPDAHTCFQALYLSAAPYDEAELLKGILLCAEHCTTFGKS
jgi:hypothetical protein